MVDRDKFGKFIKGNHYSVKTEFKKGCHWRNKKPYWNKEVLEELYINQKKSCLEISKIFNCTVHNIHYFLNKHNITSRNISEVRKLKYWGAKKEKNGMYNIKGELHPNWKGGVTPERQMLYTSSEWKELHAFILKRDNYKCQRCFNNKQLEVHHIKRFAIYPELRKDINNLITYCKKCHNEITSIEFKKNNYVWKYPNAVFLFGSKGFFEKTSMILNSNIVIS